MTKIMQQALKRRFSEIGLNVEGFWGDDVIKSELEEPYSIFSYSYRIGSLELWQVRK